MSVIFGMGRIPIFVVAVYIIFNMAAKKQTTLSFFMKGDKTSASDKKEKLSKKKRQPIFMTDKSGISYIALYG